MLHSGGYVYLTDTFLGTKPENYAQTYKKNPLCSGPVHSGHFYWNRRCPLYTGFIAYFIMVTNSDFYMIHILLI